MRRPHWPVIALLLAGGCATPKRLELAKPTQPPEMARLQGLVGTWYGNAEVVYPEPRYTEQDTAIQAASNYMKGGFKCAWLLGGLALECEGWHDVPGADRANYVEVYRWDPISETIRVWYLSDYGEHGESTLTISDDNQTLRAEGSGVNAAGKKMQHAVETTFLAADRLEWTWTEHSPWGWDQVVIKGTTRRQQ